MDEVTRAIQQRRKGVRNNVNSQFSNTLEKGAKLPIGTVRDFGGKKYVKVRDSKNGWKPYVGGEKKKEKFEKEENSSKQAQRKKAIVVMKEFIGKMQQFDEDISESMSMSGLVGNIKTIFTNWKAKTKRIKTNK